MRAWAWELVDKDPFCAHSGERPVYREHSWMLRTVNAGFLVAIWVPSAAMRDFSQSWRKTITMLLAAPRYMRLGSFWMTLKSRVHAFKTAVSSEAGKQSMLLRMALGI